MKVEICCFDKTGTLTSDNMVLEGVISPQGGSLQADTSKLDAAVARILASCQSLLTLDGQLVGDPLEKVAFQATGAVICCSCRGPCQSILSGPYSHPYYS